MFLEQRVKKMVFVWRMIMSLALCANLLISTFVYNNHGSFFLFGNISLVAIYFVGLFGIAKWLEMTTPAAELSFELKSKIIKDLNAELEAGTLIPGAELDARLDAAGLQQMNSIIDCGPVFGRIGDKEMFEWIDSKQGSLGEVQRYNYVEPAKFGPDGAAIPGTNENSLYVVVDNMMYEYKAPAP